MLAERFEIDGKSQVLDEIHRRPAYFGGPDAPLFGWYHEPASGTRRHRGVVICPPLGYENIQAHRAMRHLADQFAHAGFVALRFDYHGVGDSGGADEDANRVKAWSDSIREAVRALREASGCRDIVLVGLRMGATLAAIVANEESVSDLILWAPIVRGRRYSRELKALQLTGVANAQGPQATGVEAAGFVYTDETINDLGALNLENIYPQAQRVLMVARDDMVDDFTLRDSWQAHGLAVDYQRMPGYAEMFLEAYYRRVPGEALRRIVEWVGKSDEMAAPPANPAVSSRSSTREINIDQTRETLLQFGEDGKLFGIVSEPLVHASSDRPTIILLNSGAVHHIGSNRLYVSLTRRLAQAGFRCLRMDLQGLGDSFTDVEAEVENPYVPSTTQDIENAIETLRKEFGTSSFIVAGLCSGAYAAFHAGLALHKNSIVECLLINPVGFYWKEGMKLEVSPTKHYKEWTWYMTSMRRMGSWAKLLRGKVNLRHIVALFMNRARILFSLQARAVRKKLGAGSEAGTDDLSEDIKKISESGKYLSFIFASREPGFDVLMTNAKGMVKKLAAKKKLSLMRIDDADHTFTAKLKRDELLHKVTDYLSSRYP